MLRWGILGTGFISDKMLAAIAASAGSQAVAVAGRQPDRAQALAEGWNIPRVHRDPQALLADPEVDVVYIGTPNHTHHALTIAAAAAGKAVLAEKSLTTTMDEAHALARAVRQQGTFFAEGLMYLAHPLIAQLVALLRDGRLGRLRAVQGQYAADIWQVTNPAGQGTLFNLGCYPVSLLHLVVQTCCGPSAFADRQLAGFGGVHRAMAP